MPIYAYRCEACGFAKDVLQKMSDDALTVCPSCGKDSFKKQLTAAGFQLKGSGWYVTDFRSKDSGVANSTGATGQATEAPSSSEAAPAETSAPAAAPVASALGSSSTPSSS